MSGNSGSITVERDASETSWNAAVEAGVAEEGSKPSFSVSSASKEEEEER